MKNSSYATRRRQPHSTQTDSAYSISPPPLSRARVSLRHDDLQFSK